MLANLANDSHSASSETEQTPHQSKGDTRRAARQPQCLLTTCRTMSLLSQTALLPFAEAIQTHLSTSVSHRLQASTNVTQSEIRPYQQHLRTRLVEDARPSLAIGSLARRLGREDARGCEWSDIRHGTSMAPSRSSHVRLPRVRELKVWQTL